MDQPHRDFPLIPPPDIPFLIQSGEADLKSGKPVLDPFQVMLVPIGRKDRLPVRRLNDVLQGIQLPVMDRFISAVIRIYRSVCYLGQLPGQRCRIRGCHFPFRQL